MLMPWSMIRDVAARIYTRADQHLQSAAVVGPSAPVYGFTDEENRAAFAASGRGGIQAPKRPGVETDVAIEPGPAVQIIERQQISIFTLLKIVTAFSALYMAADPWLIVYKAGNGYNLCIRMVLCTKSLTEMILLTGSRLSAGVLFSSLTISIFSKCYATRSLLHNSWFGTVVDFEPSHDMHTYFGFLSLMAAFEHGILHCVRFTYANEAYIIYETDTGRSGVIGCLLLLPIVLPMKFEFLRTKMSFQLRKSLHMFFLPLMVALCFHSAVFRYVGTILIVWYTIDRVYFTTKQTFLIDDPFFEAVGRGTMVTLDLPTGYTFKAGSYIYVSSPMISRDEWHPFSIIPLPGAVPKATFYAEAVGDWTRELFHLGLEQPRLPLWITAAQPSLMEKSIYYDNVVLVCTGAGITPAVSIIERFAKRKNIHLLWMTRDRCMVALFEKQLRQVNSTVHLTGSPTAETKCALRSLLKPLPVNVPAATPKMSFRSIVAHCALSTTPSTKHMTAHFGNYPGVHPANAHENPFDLDTPSGRQLVLPERVTRQRSSTYHRQNSVDVNTADPVKLEFGRPNIATYLRGRFMGTDLSRTVVDDNLSTASVQAEDAFPASGTERTAGLQRSARLDTDQKISKVSLLKADENVVEACQQQRNKRVSGKNFASGTSATISRPGYPLPWLVLYCGANPKVEEAIAKTCDKVRVKWQKEYFGAW